MLPEQRCSIMGASRGEHHWPSPLPIVEDRCIQDWKVQPDTVSGEAV